MSMPLSTSSSAPSHGSGGDDGDDGSDDKRRELKEHLKRKLGAEPTRRSTRARRRPFDQIVAEKLIFAGPRYTAADPQRAGGCDSEATLGPGAVTTMNVNSDADSDKPAAMRSIRERYPEYAFKAGHLLNACFRGSGAVSTNLTALTAQANRQHQAFDEAVKRAVQALRNAYKGWYDHNGRIEDLTFGIRIRVQTTGEYWGEDSPDRYIATGLECEAELVDVPDPADVFPDDDTHHDSVATLVAAVREFVDAANENGTVDNSPA